MSGFQNPAVPYEGVRYDDDHFQNRIILSIDHQEARASQIDDGDIPGFWPQQEQQRWERARRPPSSDPRAPIFAPTPTEDNEYSRRSWDLLLAKGADRENSGSGTRKWQIPELHGVPSTCDTRHVAL